MLQLSCGHTVESLDDGIPLKTMDFEIDFNVNEFVRVCSCGEYCSKCADTFREWGIVLETEEDVKDWLSGKKNYPALIEEKE